MIPNAATVTTGINHSRSRHLSHRVVNPTVYTRKAAATYRIPGNTPPASRYPTEAPSKQNIPSSSVPAAATRAVP